MPATKVSSKWSSGNLIFYDGSGNIIFTIDGTNRKLTFASGAVLDVSAAAGTLLPAAGEIVNADVSASAAIVGSKLAAPPRINYAISKEFNIDNGSGTTDDDIILIPDRAITISSAYVYYTEATDTTGAASASVALGTAVGGTQLVAATNLQVSKAVGGKTALTLASGAGAVAANGMVAVRHTGIAATEAGKYKVIISYTVDD